MNRYLFTQVLSIMSCCSAILWWAFLPTDFLHADWVVEMILSLLQLVIVPNAFFSLLTAIVTLSSQQIKLIAKCFLKTVLVLWGMASTTLLVLWFGMANQISGKAILPTFSTNHLGLTVWVPVMMVFAVVLGAAITTQRRLHFLINPLKVIQHRISVIFEYVFVCIPILVFFVIVKFLSTMSFESLWMAMNYFMLALLFVSLMIFVLLPFLFRVDLKIDYAAYRRLVSPVALMTFLAGDSIAAVPLIIAAAEYEACEKNINLSRIITLVIICFPWLGELANLVFPIYSALLEGYGLTTVLSILSVGPFFMFTDPYISIPQLLSVLDFPELYRVTYLTLALFTDHMFEVCESIAVLYVVIRLRKEVTIHIDHKTTY